MGSSSEAHAGSRGRSSWPRKLALVGCGLVLPWLLLALLEGVLALGGWGEALLYDDPFVGFAPGSRLFEERSLADGRRVWATRVEKLAFFNPQEFPADKTPGTFRIFSLGGSTTAGRPYDDRTSFSNWLRLYLAAADPGRRFEVVNAGADSYASDRVALLMRELVRYQPDLFVVYTGHNEFLEERSYRQLRAQPEALRRLRMALAGFRFAALGRQAARALAGEQAGRATQLPAEVFTRLDGWTGLDGYHRDEALAATVARHFESNLERMVKLARAAGAESLFIEPISNLKDFSPFKSEPGATVDGEGRARCLVLLARSREALAAGEPEAARQALAEVVAIDPLLAEGHFRLGQSLVALGRFGEARESLLKARDLDVAPLRATTPLLAAIERVARREGAGWIDLPAAVEAEARRRYGHDLLGNELFEDHVHPNPRTHGRIAELIMDELSRGGQVRPAAGWTAERRRQIVDAELARLDPADLARRDLRLGKVLGWAGKLAEAEAPLRRAVAALPGDGETRLNLGILLAKTGRAEEAVPHLELARRLLPESVLAPFNLGVAYGRLGRLPEGVAALEAALRLRPDMAEAQYNLAALLRQLGRWPEAEAALGRAAALKPEAAEVHRGWARLYRSQGRLEEAEAALRKSLERESDGAGQLELASLLAERQRFAEAEAAARTALALDPAAVEAYVLLGRIAARQGRREESVRLLRAALALDARHVPATIALALVLAGQGELAPARDLLERAIAIAPRSAEAHFNLGVVLERSGSPHEAVREIATALELDPGNARIELALGMVLEALGETSRARPHLEAARAAGLSPSALAP